MILKNKLKKIISAIKDTDITSIEISSFWGFQKIKLSKNSTDNNIINEENEVLNTINRNDKTQNIITNNNDIDETASIEGQKNLDLTNLIDIKAPLVGTYYSSPKPGEPSFINVGDTIIPSQSICIIEAMKIFNEIESEVSGQVIEILVQDGDPVEYDQVLFKINPE